MTCVVSTPLPSLHARHRQEANSHGSRYRRISTMDDCVTFVIFPTAKPASKSRRNARHPTTRKWPGETRRPPRPTTPPLASLVETDALTGALRHGILGTISATTETENTRECRGGAWLPFLDTYRTMCLAPEPQFQRVLEEIGGLELSGA